MCSPRLSSELELEAAPRAAMEVLVAMEAGANAGHSQCSRSRGRRRICTHSLVSSLQSLAHRHRRCLDWRKSTYWCRSDLRAAGARAKEAVVREKEVTVAVATAAAEAAEDTSTLASQSQ